MLRFIERWKVYNRGASYEKSAENVLQTSDDGGTTWADVPFVTDPVGEAAADVEKDMRNGG